MMRYLTPFFLLGTVGCSALSIDELSGAEELLISTISSEEEGFVNHRMAAEENAPEQDRPKMFRECKRGDFFEQVLARYDENANQELDESESEVVKADREEHGTRNIGKLRRLMNMLLWVYDSDGDDELSAAERESLFADFDQRCETIHANILADFDADGDGELSDEEKQAAHDAMKEKRSEHGKKSWGEKPDGPGEKPQEGELPKFAQEFDADSNGELSEGDV